MNDRLAERRDLLRIIDRQVEGLERTAEAAALGVYQQRAVRFTKENLKMRRCTLTGMMIYSLD